MAAFEKGNNYDVRGHCKGICNVFLFKNIHYITRYIIISLRYFRIKETLQWCLNPMRWTEVLFVLGLVAKSGESEPLALDVTPMTLKSNTAYPGMFVKLHVHVHHQSIWHAHIAQRSTTQRLKETPETDCVTRVTAEVIHRSWWPSCDHLPQRKPTASLGDITCLQPYGLLWET